MPVKQLYLLKNSFNNIYYKQHIFVQVGNVHKLISFSVSIRIPK